MKPTAAAVLIIAVLTSACATVMSEQTQPVAINSSPEGAAIVVNGVAQWTTPHVLQLDAENPPEMTIRLDGYEPVAVRLMNAKAGIDPWFWGNIFNYGIGAVIDWQTGAMWKWELQDRVVVELERQP